MSNFQFQGDFGPPLEIEFCRTTELTAIYHWPSSHYFAAQMFVSLPKALTQNMLDEGACDSDNFVHGHHSSIWIE